MLENEPRRGAPALQPSGGPALRIPGERLEPEALDVRMEGPAGLGTVGVQVHLMAPLDQADDLIQEGDLREHRKECGEERHPHGSVPGERLGDPLHLGDGIVAMGTEPDRSLPQAADDPCRLEAAMDLLDLVGRDAQDPRSPRACAARRPARRAASAQASTGRWSVRR